MARFPRPPLVAALVLLGLGFASFAFGQEAPPAPAPAAPAAQVSVWVAIAIAVGWAAFTGLVNTLFDRFTPADVDAWAERRPTLAFVAAVFRRAGFEPVALLADLRDWMKGNPPAPHFGNAAMGKRRTWIDPAPISAPRSPRRGFVEARALGVLAGIALGLVACALAAACQLLTPAFDLGVCEARVAITHPGASLAELVKASLEVCGRDGQVLVADILHALLDSKDPALAPYQPAARAALAEPAQMGALRAAVGHP